MKQKHEWQLDVENDNAPRCHRCGEYLRGPLKYIGVLCQECAKLEKETIKNEKAS